MDNCTWLVIRVGARFGHPLPINSSCSMLHRLLPMMRFGLDGLSILWACIMQR